jgi:YHS domain-containing protein
MKKLMGLGLVACLALVIAAGCSKPTTETGQKTCPVMGKDVNVKIFTEYQGRKIYFCCEECKAEFAKNPKKYVKIVDAELKQIAKDKAAAEAAKAVATPAPAKKK